MLQYEADGSFLVRERGSASPLPRGHNGGMPGAVCELVYVYQGRPHSKDVEVTRRGVRFRGGHSYFEDLAVLVLSYTASPGDELRCVLTHAPGQSPHAAALIARAADNAASLDQNYALESFAFDARTKHRRNRKVRKAVLVLFCLCTTFFLLYPPCVFSMYPPLHFRAALQRLWRSLPAVSKTMWPRPIGSSRRPWTSRQELHKRGT